jgi:VanZ family protein
LVVALLCTAVVLSLTHIPGEAMPRVVDIRGLDKVIHCTAYAMITASFLFAVDRRAGWRLPVILVLGILALGAVDELTQPFVRRTCSGWDFLADMIGIAIACGIWKAASVRAAGRRVGANAAKPQVSVVR